MSKSFTVRPFRSGDEVAICALHAAAIRAVPEAAYPRDLIESWASGKTPETYVRAQVDLGETYRVAVDQTDRPVGFCSFVGDEIKGLYVDPRWQGLGVGTALLHTAEIELMAAGAHTLKVHAARSAYSFYEHMGYTRMRIDYHTTRGGQTMEAAWYARCVQP